MLVLTAIPFRPVLARSPVRAKAGLRWRNHFFYERVRALLYSFLARVRTYEEFWS